MSVLIFANGDLESLDWLRPYLAQAGVVIAVNDGTRHLCRLQRPPDILIGDLDSLPREIEQWAEMSGTLMMKHPTAKDETDLELALIYAAENDYVDIKIVSACGGRNLQKTGHSLGLAGLQRPKRSYDGTATYRCPPKGSTFDTGWG